MGVGAQAPPLARRSILVLALLVASCTRPPVDEPGRPGPDLTFPTRQSLRIAIDGTPESLDPIELDSSEELLVAEQVFDGLTAYASRSLATVPAAAESWDVEDGGRRFVFHLVPGATFHDGSPVRARDFVFAWNRLADPLVAAPFSFLLERVVGYDRYQSEVRVRGLEGLRALDDETLEVRLTIAWPDFVSVLAHPALSPVPSGATGLGFGERPSGNGPFRLATDLGAGAEIRLERFDDHPAPTAGVDRIELVTFDDPDDAWPEFLGGDLDVAPIPASLLDDAVGTYGSAGVVPLARLLYCGFNMTDPRFGDRALRRAVSVAIDRDAVAAGVYGGLAAPATGVVPSSVPGGGTDVCGDLCEHHPERASALVGELPRVSRTFSLDYTASDVGEELAAALKGQLVEAGFTVRLRGHEARAYAELLRTGEQQLFCLVWVADYPRQEALLEPLYLSTSPDNHADVDLASLDRLLIGGRAAERRPERVELYRETERIATSAMPLVPVVWFRSHLAAKPYVEGLSVSPLGTFDAASLRIAG